MKQRATLVEVRGNQEEFADVIGTTEILHLHELDNSPELNFFGDVGLSVKRVVKKDNRISISTRLGNTFVFQLI